jgi:hypothetical protein
MMRLVKVLLVVGILISPFVGTYVASPQIAAWLATRYAAELGLSELEVVIGRPGSGGMRIESLTAVGEGYRAVISEAALSYSLSGLRAGRLEELTVGDLHLVLEPTADSSEPGAIADAESTLEAEALFALAPFDRARIDSLVLQVPAVGFEGQGDLAFADETLTLKLTGLEPAEVRGFVLESSLSASGEVSAALSGSVTTSGSTSEPFIRIQSELPDDRFELSLDVRLTGFALDLISAIGGLPEGDGTIDGQLRVSHPWPIDEGLDLLKLEVRGPFAMQWDSAGAAVSTRSLAGNLVLVDGALQADLEGSLQLEIGELEITASPGSLRGTLTPLSASLTTELVASAELGQLEGGATIDLRVEREAFQAAGMEFQGFVEAFEQRFPLDLVAQARQSPEQIDAEVRLTSGVIEDLPVVVRYVPDDERIQLTVSHEQPFAEPLIRALWPPWSEPYDLDQGTVRIDAQMAGQISDLPAGSAQIGLAGVAAHYEETMLRSVAGELILVFEDDDVTIEPSAFGASLVDLGVPLREVTMVVNGTPELLEISDVKALVLGGQISVSPFEYDVEDGKADALLTLADLDLGEILALEGEYIAGSGRVDGTLPVRIRADTVSVSDGRIAVRPPGGTIRLSAGGIAGALTQPGLDLALGALTDFRFDVLEASVNYSDAGDLQLGIRLEGRNPEIEKGRPIHYNLNVSENIPVLLQSLRLQDTFTERIEKEVLR